ncbi:MAG: protein kinase domain-containing protein [Rhizomicrobium sp.]
MSYEATLRELAPGQKVFGRYTLRKILGRGAMGVVWLGRDEELERDVALKFLPELVVLDRAVLGELKRETRRSLELTHKNIVRIHDFVQGENSACISMEYVDGDTLSNLRAEKATKVFEPNEIAAWTAQLCDALDYAHNHARIIHRDLKPANLIISRNGELKVSDFGIARSLGETAAGLTMEQGRSGTLVYMSPQQLNGDRGTHLDDIYSLGATLYDLLTSKPPFYSGNIDRQIQERAPPSMTERRRDLKVEPASVPAIWEEVVAACLQKDPAKRPQSTAEIANRLQLALPAGGRTRRDSSRLSRTKALALIGIGLVAIAAAAGWYFSKLHTRPSGAARGTSASSQPGEIPEKSVAVLPFENLSADKDDAFFADGIQDDVLTSLGKIQDLTVIARASVMTYRGEAAAGKLREIGKTLRVAHVLQGSVRRLANQVVVNVQLVDTRNDRQIWSERYERTLTNALSLQGEVAVAIARELQAALTPNELKVAATKPTDNPEAYLLYLKARELEMRMMVSEVDPEAVTKLYQQAIDLDPTFALARARLSMRLSFASSGADGDPILRGTALAEAQEASRLRPGMGEARLALALYYWGANEIDRALAELAEAEKMLPNSAEVWQTRATIYRKQNKIRERIAALRRAETLDPRDSNVLRLLVMTLRDVRDWSEAEQAGKRVQAVAHGGQRRHGIYARSWDKFRSTGKLDALRQELAAAPAGPEGDQSDIHRSFQFELAMLERDFATAERLLHELPAEAFDGDPHPKIMQEALVAVGRGGDRVGIEQALAAARHEIDKLRAASPNDYYPYTNLGLIDAFLGRKEEAIREGQRAVELAASRSPLEENDASAALALIYARTGKSDLAMELIEHLLTVPADLTEDAIYNMTVAELKWRWVWDPLREDQRFQKILAEPEPQTVY